MNVQSKLMISSQKMNKQVLETSIDDRVGKRRGTNSWEKGGYYYDKIENNEESNKWRRIYIRRTITKKIFLK